MSNFFNRQKENTDKKYEPNYLLRLVAGGYLLYLVYDIFKGGSLSEYSGGKLALMIAFIAIFIACGILFIIQGVKGLMKNSGMLYGQERSSPEDSDEDEYDDVIDDVIEDEEECSQEEEQDNVE